MGNSIVVPQKIKNRLPDDLPVPILGMYWKELKAWILPVELMFTAALFKTAKMWKPPKFLPTDEQISKMRHYLQSPLLHGTSKARYYMAILYKISKSFYKAQILIWHCFYKAQILIWHYFIKPKY